MTKRKRKSTGTHKQKKASSKKATPETVAAAPKPATTSSETPSSSERSSPAELPQAELPHAEIARVEYPRSDLGAALATTPNAETPVVETAIAEFPVKESPITESRITERPVAEKRRAGTTVPKRSDLSAVAVGSPAAHLTIVPSPLEPTEPPSAKVEASPASDPVRPAGPIRRFLAFLYDVIFLATIFIIALAVRAGLTLEQFMQPLGTDRPLLLPQIKASFLVVIIGWAIFAGVYLALCDALPVGGTLGKRLLNMRVRDLQGQRISLLRSVFRVISSFATVATLGIGYLIGFFRADGKMLQDLIARTKVVRDPASDSGS